MAIELSCVGLAGLLALVQLLLAAAPRALRMGPTWAIGPRDRPSGDVSVQAQRADRAARNMMETYPIFAGAALAAVAADATDVATALGAQVYLVARVLYVPAYVFHLGPLRSLVWVAGFVGLLMVLSPFVRALLP